MPSEGAAPAHRRRVTGRATVLRRAARRSGTRGRVARGRVPRRPRAWSSISARSRPPSAGCDLGGYSGGASQPGPVEDAYDDHRRRGHSADRGRAFRDWRASGRRRVDATGSQVRGVSAGMRPSRPRVEQRARDHRRRHVRRQRRLRRHFSDELAAVRRRSQSIRAATSSSTFPSCGALRARRDRPHLHASPVRSATTRAAACSTPRRRHDRLDVPSRRAGPAAAARSYPEAAPISRARRATRRAATTAACGSSKARDRAARRASPAASSSARPTTGRRRADIRRSWMTCSPTAWRERP